MAVQFGTRICEDIWVAVLVWDEDMPGYLGGSFSLGRGLRGYLGGSFSLGRGYARIFGWQLSFGARICEDSSVAVLDWDEDTRGYLGGSFSLGRGYAMIFG